MTARGDVVIVDFPFTSGKQSKVRPALVIQNDRDNQRLAKTVIAMITGNVRRAAERTHLLIDPTTPEGTSSGLHGPSLLTCLNLYTIDQSGIIRTVGYLMPSLMDQVDQCLKEALAIP